MESELDLRGITQKPSIHSTPMYSYPYPRPAVTADSVVFGTDEEGECHILLIERGNDPFKGQWALPGGFMDMDETLEECARRELMEETGIKVQHMDEVGSFSTVDRDPRGRTITVAFMTEIPITEAHGGDDAKQARWFSIDALPPLAFDHATIIQAAILKQRSCLKPN